jgi:N-acetylmuramoyl-L-alanine amidase
MIVLRVTGLLVLIMVFSSYQPVRNNHSNFRVKTVVLDAGHGGKDPGCVSGKIYEKDIALTIALKLGRNIEKNFKDINVIYTRRTDTFIELRERPAIANRNKANIFISIHVNASKNPAQYGTETYVMGIEKTISNLEVSKRENDVILLEDNYKSKYDGFDPNSPEGNIIFSLYQNAFIDQSLSFASKIENQFKNRAKRESKGVKQAGFLVLWKTAMPSVLVETGFLSNAEEKQYLVTDTGQTRLSSSIYKAFCEFKNDLEGLVK